MIFQKEIVQMKKTIISIIAVLLIFIPTYIAIANYIATNNSPISTKYVEKVKIFFDSENTYEVVKKDSPDDIAAIVALNENATPVSELPEPLQNEKFFMITFYSGSVTEECKYYLKLNGEQSYYVNAKGEGHKLRNEDVLAFLATPYANYLYTDSEDVTLPLLYTASGSQQIIPASVEWTYNADGQNPIDIKGFKTTDQIISYEMEGGISLDFAVAADDYDIVILDKDSNEVFNQQGITDLAEISLGDNNQVTFMLTAHWYEDDTRAYHGSATYNFKANLLAGAEFYLGETTVDRGDFVTITGYNVSDPSRIVFTSEPDIGYTPTFYRDGDKVVALVPIKAELEHKSYQFTLTYGSVSQPITLAIGNKTFGNKTHTMSELIASNRRSEEALAEFDKIFAELCATSSETKYFDGTFIDYEPKPDGIGLATIVCGFGHMRTISSTKETYRNIGVDFKCDAGIELPASNNGKVVYADQTIYGGKMVVIDHGFGLKTWYLHLDSINVSVGDEVKTNDIIGTSGKTGFTETSGVYTIMTVGDVPVCPYGPWESGVIIHSK